MKSPRKFKLILIAIATLVTLEALSRIGVRYWVQRERFEHWHGYLAAFNDGRIGWMFGDFTYHPFLTYSRGKDVTRADRLLARPKDDVFRIGLIGGSFAHVIANSLLHDRVATDELKYIFRDLSQKREIEILDLSADAARQPRQMIATALYRDVIDFFIDIEGMGEVAVSNGTCAPAFYPRLIHVYDSSLATWQQRAADVARVTYSGAQSLSGTVVGSSDFYRLMWYVVGPRLIALHDRLMEAHVASIREKTCDPSRTNDDDPESRAREWVRFLSAQHDLLNSDGNLRVVTFIHPIQFIDGAKIASPEERSLVPDRQPDWREVAVNYRNAVARLHDKFKGDPSVVDTTMIFKDVSRTLYADDCCHLNDDGSSLYVNRMLTLLRDRLKHRRLAGTEP